MKKKKILKTLVIFAILIVVIIWLILKNNIGYPKNNIGYTVIKNGYSSYESKIISNYQEYIKFVDYIDKQNLSYGKIYDFNPSKYNEKYFIFKSLAIINIFTWSGMDVLNDIDISIIDNTLVCKADIDYAQGIVTADVDGVLILVEINKSITNFKIEK